MAAVTSAVVAGAALGYTVYSGEKARSDAKKEKRQIEAEQEEAISTAEKQAADKESIENVEKNRDAAKKRQRARAAGSRGRSSTILTGPSGNAGASIGDVNGGKTLIGL